VAGSCCVSQDCYTSTNPNAGNLCGISSPNTCGSCNIDSDCQADQAYGNGYICLNHLCVGGCDSSINSSGSLTVDGGVGCATGYVCCGHGCDNGDCCSSNDCSGTTPICDDFICSRCSSDNDCISAGKGNTCDIGGNCVESGGPSLRPKQASR
jgi:hypothetical protein